MNTLGPWTYDDGKNVFAGRRLVANCGGYSTNIPNDGHMEENQANARLIAAAPELLEACQNALGAYESLKLIGADKELPGYERCLAFLKESIRKAKE